MSTGATTVVKKRQLRTGLLTILSVSGTIVGVLFLSAVDNPDGTPWLESTIIGQTLVTLGVVASAILPSLLGARKDAAVTRDQLENAHVDAPGRVSNVRDDLDGKHERTVDILAAIDKKIDRRFDTVASDVRGIRRDIGRLWDKAESNSGRILDLEQTQDPTRKD
jgi:hypothetical protein